MFSILAFHGFLLIFTLCLIHMKRERWKTGEEMHDYLILTNIKILHIQENFVKFSQLIEVLTILLIIGINIAFCTH